MSSTKWSSACATLTKRIVRRAFGLVSAPMFEQSYNAVVNYTLATSAEEIDQVFSRLSRIAATGLAAELEVAGDVHRYDAVAKRAYYFERQGTNLAVWS